MYATSRHAGARTSSWACAGDLSARRLYSAPRQTTEQVLLNMARQRRDTSDWWKRPAKAAPLPRKGMNNQPYAGGFSRNRLKPTPLSHALPEIKPFFATQPQVVKASPVPGTAKPATDDRPQAEAQVARPKPALGGAGFFFRSKGATVSTELPSAKWAPKLIPKQSIATPEKADSTVESKRVGSKPAMVSGVRKPQIGEQLSPLEMLRKAREMNKARAAGRSQNLKKAADVVQQEIQQPASQADPRLKADAQVLKGKSLESWEQEQRGKLKKGRGGTSRRAGRDMAENDQEYDEDEQDKRKRRTRVKLPKKGKELTLPLTITVDGLAKLLEVPNDHLLRKMSHMGLDKLANDYLLSGEEAADIVLEYGVTPVIPEDTGPELYPQPVPEDMTAHPLRPPVVTIMGHVDHGKTTLLDTLRNSSITATEAGGITQHIGAFSVQMKSGQNITFLDTPGHAAFSAMRARGANATDVVVLVVAADDGVMPQTKEAIQHALDADVPIIVAINKCDKPGIDPSRIQNDLLQYGIHTEDLGGDIQAVEISALKGDGVEELSESIVTLAEVLDLRAEVDIPAHATIIESQVEKGRGNVASVLVKRGTLKIGDIVVAGSTWCKVRSMTDDRGKSVKSAGPASAVRVMGWKEIPHAGDMVLQAESEAQAKHVVAHRIDKRKKKEQLGSLEAMNEKRREIHLRESTVRAEQKAHAKAVWEFHQGLRSTHPEPLVKTDKHTYGAAEKSSPDTPEIPIIPVVIKGDVSGTVEAVEAALKNLPSTKIKPVVLSTGVGQVTESDVVMASSSDKSVIIAFNVKADKKTQTKAKREHVEIMSYRIIYKLLEDFEKLMLGRLPPVFVEEVQGEAVVQQVFDITLKGNRSTRIAGSRVTSGTISRAALAQVLRGGKVVFSGEISSLKNVKADIAESTKGQEFGIAFTGFDDLREGDIVQSMGKKEIQQKLD